MIKKLIIGSAGIALLAATALTAFAQTSTSTPAGRTDRIDVACIQAAIEKRDTSIISAVDFLSNAGKTALQARKDALKNGWAITDKAMRRAALKSAWNVYRGAVKKARANMKTALRSSWNQFETDRKACRVSNEGGDSIGIDSQL